MKCDVTSEESVKAAFANVKSKINASAGGRLDTMIYCPANKFGKAPFLELKPENVKADWEILCLGAMHCSQQAIPLMLEKNGGSLLFAGATSAMRGKDLFASIAIGKFGLRALSQSSKG